MVSLLNLADICHFSSFTLVCLSLETYVIPEIINICKIAHTILSSEIGRKGDIDDVYGRVAGVLFRKSFVVKLCRSSAVFFVFRFCFFVFV